MPLNNLSPLAFGAEGENTQITRLAESVLSLTQEQAFTHEKITREIGDILKNVVFSRHFLEGILPEDYLTWLESHHLTGGILYFGLDIYSGVRGNPKIVEINSHPQSFGQEERARALGIEDYEGFPSQLIEELFERGFRNIAVLGSTKNAFWRSHKAFSARINSLGGNGIYTDIAGMQGLITKGEQPDVVLRLVSNTSLRNEAGELLLQSLEERGIPVFNSLQTPILGYRQVLEYMQQVRPDLFPKVSHNLDEYQQYPWLKLDGPNGYAFVTNLAERRSWERAIIFSIINRQYNIAEQLLAQKGENAITIQLNKLLTVAATSDVNWILQEAIIPQIIEAQIDGAIQPAVVLHRTTGIIKLNGDITVSHEAYAVTREQYRQAKGKINGGTGFYMHPVIE